MESSYSSRKCVNLYFEPPVLAEKTFVFNPNTQTLSFVDHTIKVIFIKSTLPFVIFLHGILTSMIRKRRWRVSNLESNVIQFFQLGKQFIHYTIQ